jgi:hypothetical protein
MSERDIHSNPEHFSQRSPERQAQKEAEHHKPGPEAHKHPANKDIEAIRHSIDKEARKAAEHPVDKAAEAPKEHYFVNKELKAESFRRTLNRARKHLSAPEQLLSKTIHKPAIDTASKAAEKTVARPYPLLVGGFVAVVMSGYMLYAAKHYGHNYNYLLVFMLFLGGYVAGLILEPAIRLVRRHKP